MAFTDFSRHGFCLQNLANVVSMSSEEDFFSEFYYPDEIVTKNEGNVGVLPISRALPS